ncbi:unnamed protein product [Somion occarium]|uniref:Uncharacterized protein n=1 Tax=Somion occarium TaxID=3059160 RepID=A0ABP1DH27_9APHY
MRKTSYVVTFFAVTFTLVLNILSAYRPDWLVVNNELLGSKTTVLYGLMERCERQVVVVPGMPDRKRIEYTDYRCRPFPARTLDGCDKENKMFCVAWTTAGYFTELSIGFAVVACLAIIFGVSTHSRRRRIWRAVAGFVALHAASQLTTFAIITELYRESKYPTFEYARPGTAYVLNGLSWVAGVLVTIGVIITGISANKGHRWAAGNRAYRPIEG